MEQRNSQLQRWKEKLRKAPFLFPRAKHLPLRPQKTEIEMDTERGFAAIALKRALPPRETMRFHMGGLRLLPAPQGIFARAAILRVPARDSPVQIQTRRKHGESNGHPRVTGRPNRGFLLSKPWFRLAASCPAATLPEF